MTEQSKEVVIKGLTQDGKPFRPSDWAERLCGVLSVFGAERRMEYSPLVHPITSAGIRCVVVNIELEELEPMAFKFLMSFAKDNELQVRPGRLDKRPEEGGEAGGAAKVTGAEAGGGGSD
jgi:hypothetical protein